MSGAVGLALELARDLRASRGFRELDPQSRDSFDRDLRKLEAALSRPPNADPYAEVLGLTDLQNKLADSARVRDAAQKQAAEKTSLQGAQSPLLPSQTAELGRRAAEALESVDFPGFVAALITGTFQAIVDSSAQQIRRYAELVQSLTQTLEDFSGENVTPNQARDALAAKQTRDLMIRFPAPGAGGTPRLVPRPESEGTSPAWLERYGLKGAELTEELTEGELLERGRLHAGEDRLQLLATMVLMGINRIVVNEGDIRAKVRFTATARDELTADVEKKSSAIAARNLSGAPNVQMLVSTVKANAQAEASIKADLLGEVRVSFRSETFPLERFADSAAIQLINRHAKWREEPARASQPAPTPPPSGEGPTQ